MLINDPVVVAEVTEIFNEYEKALLENDTARLDAMFLNSDFTVRYGVADVQYGIDEVRSFRATQKPFDRTLSRTVISTFGRDFAITSTLFRRPDSPGQIGRQTQSWVRMESSWKVAAAHVSMISADAG